VFLGGLNVMPKVEGNNLGCEWWAEKHSGVIANTDMWHFGVGMGILNLYSIVYSRKSGWRV
jgi:hypothetical protein